MNEERSLEEILADAAADSADAKRHTYFKDRPGVGVKCYIPVKPRHHVRPRHEYGGRVGMVIGHITGLYDLVYVLFTATSEAPAEWGTVSWHWMQELNPRR